MKKTKIVATIGPSSSNKDVLLKMIQSGTDVIRINFSHSKYEEVILQIKMIKEINQTYGYNTAILADLQGPKLRIGIVAEGAFLNVGELLTFTNEKIDGDSSKVYMTYKNFANDVKVGENILIDDGKLLLKVIKTNLKDEVVAEVIQGGPLKSKKGVNLPNTNVSLPALTEKDIEDAVFAIKQGVDWLALSFVRHAKDVTDLKDLIKIHSPNYNIPIIAKIEKPEALINIDEILNVCDALMVARGDLGVEIPMEEVPLAQKMLVSKAKTMHKPVIIATQMMESMLESLTPSRAEVNDVANSVMDGADAVMLSGETSVGKYPVEVIKTITKIIQKVENAHQVKVSPHPPHCLDERFITNIVCYNAAKMVNETEAKVLVTHTMSGHTAFQVSSHRPLAHILVFTSNRVIVNMLNLLWGVRAFYYEALKSTDETVIEVNRFIVKEGFATSGDFVINLNAMPVSGNGITNTIRLTKIK